MKHTINLFFLLIAITFSACKQNQTTNTTTATVDLEKLDAYYSKMVKDWNIPSASIGIVKDGKLVFTGNYGVLEEGKPEQPNQNTLYAIASNSKAFTSALIGMLVQEGKLDWNDKVKKHLPYFSLFNDEWISSEMTIRDLLSHRSGLGSFSGDVIWNKSSLTSEEIIKRAKHLPKAFDFRDGWGYSNLMFITAGEIIKKVSGKTWAENVQERILRPLNMDRTLTSIKELKNKGNFATPHGFKNESNFPIDWVDWSEIGAMGGLISNVEDISKWMIFNLNNGIHKNDTILSAKTRNMVWTPHNNFDVDHTSKNDFNRHFSGYGLAWSLSDYHGKLRVGHTGGFDGMISAITMIPDENLGVVVLTNGMKSPIMAATYHALDLYLGVSKKDWSADMLKEKNESLANDTRISDRKEKRVLDSKPSLALSAYTADYTSDIYGTISISEKDGELRLDFEHSPDLSATFRHWQNDEWEIVWDKKHAWFSFGTVKFKLDANKKVTGFDFDVPNDDFFFEEFKPYRANQ